MKLNPTDYTCPDCLAESGEPCTRLSGPYGFGNPLRRTHPARRTEGIRVEMRRTRRQVSTAVHRSEHTDSA